MRRSSLQRGTGLLLVAAALFAATAALVMVRLGAASISMERERATQAALAQAREALLAYASERAINAAVGPGHLPCPDLDDDGWAESTCGSLSGDRGQEERLGRLPWKTLGLADLRDGHGERLWYAVSTRYKGLLNCAASSACVDLSPASALGTITVRDNTGRVLHDGTLADPARGGAIAVVLAPGPPLPRLASAARVAREQRRDCALGDCRDPANYLDAAPAARSGEDNADFVDRSDAARARNGNGFIQGPVTDADGRLVVNDRLAAITYQDVMPRLMRRVALEVGHCLAYYASRPENAGRLPEPAPACFSSPAGAPFGRVPETPFSATGGMLERWWRAAPRVPEALSELPTAAQACRLATAPADDGVARSLPPGMPPQEGETAGRSQPAWWTFWRPFVIYAPAAALRAAAASGDCTASGACLQLVTTDGQPIGQPRRAAVVVSTRADQCAARSLDCDATRCVRVFASGPGLASGEVVHALP